MCSSLSAHHHSIPRRATRLCAAAGRVATVLAVAVVLVAITASIALAAAEDFSNTAFLQVPPVNPCCAAKPASLYPATIDVTGLAGKVTKITATLHGLSHENIEDLAVLLVGPAGQNVVLMASYDLGGCCASHVVSDATITFDDAGIEAECPGHGTPFQTIYPYRPFNCGVLAPYPAPAPAPPYGSALAAFNGTNPNGTWSLFVTDDRGTASGSIADGWSLHVETDVQAASPTPSAPGAAPTAPQTTAVPTPTPLPTRTAPKKPSRAQLLAAAIRRCHKIKNNAKRRRCDATAQRRYGHRPSKRRDKKAGDR